MVSLSHVTTVSGVQSGPGVILSDLDLQDGVLYATSAAGRSLTAYEVHANGSLQALDQRSLHSNAGRLDLIEVDGQLRAVVIDPVQGQPAAYRLSSGDQLLTSSTPDLDQSGTITGLGGVVQAGGYFYASCPEIGEVVIYRELSDGSVATQGQPTALSGGVSDLMAVETGAGSFLMAISETGSDLTLYDINGSGGLSQRGQSGATQGLGVAAISACGQASLPDGDYVIIAAQGSSSLSVLRVTSGGQLIPVDHVIDDLNTRFQSVTTLEVVTIEDRVFVIVGGGDDGLTVFALLPGGRLLEMATLIDSDDMTLENVSAIAAEVTGDEIQIFAGSGTEAGLTQITLDPGNLGETWIGGSGGETHSGTGADDILFGAAGNDSLMGGNGDDILMDGAGQDTLWGGSGQDIFVMEADGQLDEIRDFNRFHDRLDLSAWLMLRNPDQITVYSTSYGARLVYRDEEIRIYSHDGQSLSRAQVLGNDVINLSRVPVGDPEIEENFYGTGENDVLSGNWASNLVVGRAGNDTLSGGDGDDLMRGGAGRDEIYGDAGNDEIYGQGERDLIYGGAGQDSLQGAWLNDTLYGGDGQDLVDGGSADDRVYGQDGDDTVEGGGGKDSVYGGSGNDEVRGGPGNDTLYGGGGHDMMTAATHSDLLYGDGGNDTLRGQDGQDTLVGGTGHDVLTGGAHRDSFVFFSGDGRDTITDFVDDIDTLELDDALWDGDISAGQVIKRYARVENGNTILEFDDGTTITVQGINDPDLLTNDLLIF